MYADFHNDVLTKLGKYDYPDDITVVAAVFNKKLPFQRALDLTELAPIYAFEDVGYPDIDEEKLIQKNPVYVGLTWNGENEYAYGCHLSGGVKQKGLNLIKKLNGAKIAVDTAHISKEGFKDIIDNAETVVNSHTAINLGYKHMRNLDLWQLDLLAERNALVGLTFCGFFFTDDKVCPINKFIEQVDFFCQRYGSKRLCIGTDFNGCDFTVGDFKDYSCYETIRRELEKLGYKKSDIDGILYGNLNNFLKSGK